MVSLEMRSKKVFWTLGFWYLVLFSISNLGFRIYKIMEAIKIGRTLYAG
ncbi:hypothetical protein C5S32_05140 [ANME-1 cluster archaeon GoMg1]|nr:hypothetical protein [ANME-1 cluster archaeon GoMg1]